MQEQHQCILPGCRESALRASRAFFRGAAPSSGQPSDGTVTCLAVNGSDIVVGGATTPYGPFPPPVEYFTLSTRERWVRRSLVHTRGSPGR